MKHVVKRKGHAESYDEKKIYASAYAAALNCHYKEEKAEELANIVTKKVNSWIKSKQAVTSEEIRDQIIQSIPDPEVALMYRSHLDLC